MKQISRSDSDTYQWYQKHEIVRAELMKWRHELKVTRAKRGKPETLSQLAQSARDTSDIDRITKILELRG